MVASKCRCTCGTHIILLALRVPVLPGTGTGRSPIRVTCTPVHAIWIYDYRYCMYMYGAPKLCNYIHSYYYLCMHVSIHICTTCTGTNCFCAGMHAAHAVYNHRSQRFWWWIEVIILVFIFKIEQRGTRKLVLASFSIVIDARVGKYSTQYT